MSTVVFYARCSTRAQATGHSIVRQIDRLTQYAKENDLTVVGIFVDIASRYTGPLPQRDAAIDRAKGTSGRMILVEDLDRWGPLPCDLGNVMLFPVGVR